MSEYGLPISKPSQDQLDSMDEKLRGAIALHQLGQLEAAEAAYKEILNVDARHFDAWRLIGTIAAQRGHSSQAIEYFVQALEINQNHPGLLNNLGYALRDLSRFEDALRCYDRAIDLQPDFADAYNNRGLLLVEMNQAELALKNYDQALALAPHNAKAHRNRGALLCRMGQPEAALGSFERASTLEPRDAEAHYRQGNALSDLRRYEEAITSYQQAVLIRSDYVEALNNQGLAWLALKQYPESLMHFDRALEIRPENAEILCNKGNALAEMDRKDEALSCLNRALELKPDLAKAHVNRGNLFSLLRQHNAALDCYERALEISPSLTDAINNRAVILYECGRLDEALSCFEDVLALSPAHLQAQINRGNVLRDLRRYDEAEASFRGALQVNPEHDFLYGTWLHTKMRICDWLGLDTQIQKLEAMIQQGQKVSPPFPVLAVTESLSLTQKVAETWVRTKCPANSNQLPNLDLPRHRRIRLGYFSADFHNHATSYLIAELLEKHDKTQFELFGFSFGPPVGDRMAQRVASAFEHFLEVRALADKEIALLARQLEIDIAVDLKGHTQDARTQIFAWRAAPIQVNYLGYPGTMGAEYMDYLIADATVLPHSDQALYSEEVIYLPHCYQANDTQKVISQVAFTRTEMGLPDRGFVFCCFNSTYKITPTVFQSWMRILNQVDGSVLWLFEDNAIAVENLRATANSLGVDAANRLIFAKRMPLETHLSRHKLADLFLDTQPCCAHTTASDALWAGLPVLTCLGATFAGRVAASLLNAIGLPELVATNMEAYEAHAIALARNPEKLNELKTRLAENKLTAPLFNSGLFAQNLEDAYKKMYERYHSEVIS